MAIQSAFHSLIITPANYLYDVLNGVYENTPLKKTCEVSSRFFNSLLKKPKDLVKGVETASRCFVLILKNEELITKVQAVATGAGKFKGWLTLLSLPDQINQALNSKTSNVVSFKDGDRLIWENGSYPLREGDTLHLTRQAPSMFPNAEFQLQNGILREAEEQVVNGDAIRDLPENSYELRLSNGKRCLLSNGTRFQLGDRHVPAIEENENASNIFAKPQFRKALSAWAGVYIGVFESAKFLNITRIASPVFFQLASMFAIVLGAAARLGDDHKKYQAQGFGLENALNITGNASVFAIGAISLINKKANFRNASNFIFFFSAVNVLTNLSGHFLKSMHAPRYEDINTLLQT